MPPGAEGRVAVAVAAVNGDMHTPLLVGAAAAAAAAAGSEGADGPEDDAPLANGS